MLVFCPFVETLRQRTSTIWKELFKDPKGSFASQRHGSEHLRTQTQIDYNFQQGRKLIAERFCIFSRNWSSSITCGRKRRALTIIDPTEDDDKVRSEGFVIHGTRELVLRKKKSQPRQKTHRRPVSVRKNRFPSRKSCPLEHPPVIILAGKLVL